MGSPVTVFRSADESARVDANAIMEMLADAGIPAALADDSAPGVPQGACEVRVDEANRERAEDLIAKFSAEEEAEAVDPSHELDVAAVFRGDGTTAEMEALSVQSVLEDAGLTAIIVGDSRYPNLGWEVRVAREHQERALEILREAQAAGPAAAEEAEKATE